MAQMTDGAVTAPLRDTPIHYANDPEMATPGVPKKLGSQPPPRITAKTPRGSSVTMSRYIMTPRELVLHFSDLPYPSTDCAGKVFIVTGANTGIGLEAARHLVRLNAANVIVGCRDLAKGHAAKASIEATTQRRGVVDVWHVDLGSFDSVKDFCARADALPRLDAVIENAGLCATSFAMLEGHESQITVNVISTMLMALLLLPALRRTAARHNITPHVAVVGSCAHFYTNMVSVRDAPAVFQELRKPHGMHERYLVSKLLQLLVTRELAARITASAPQRTPVIVNNTHPGWCNTGLFRNVPLPFRWLIDIASALVARSDEQGSRTLLAATFAGSVSHGQYMQSCQVWDPSPWAQTQHSLQVQKKAFDELLDILEAVQPGISKNI